MDVNDKNFEEEVMKSELPVFIELWASWCPPCKMMAPVMESLEEHYKGKVKVCKMNIDINRKTADKFNVKGVPTFMIIKDGEVIKREVSAKSEDQLKKMIDEELSKQ